MAEATAAADAMAAIVVVAEGDMADSTKGATGVAAAAVEVVDAFAASAINPDAEAVGIILASLPARDRPVRPKRVEPPRRIFSDRLLIKLAAEEERGRPLPPPAIFVADN